MTSWGINKRYLSKSALELRNYAANEENKKPSEHVPTEVSLDQTKTRRRRKLPTTPNPPTFQTDIRAQRPRVRDVLLKYRASTTIGKVFAENGDTNSATSSDPTVKPQSRPNEDNPRSKRRVLPSTKALMRDQGMKAPDSHSKTSPLSSLAKTKHQTTLPKRNLTRRDEIGARDPNDYVPKCNNSYGNGSTKPAENKKIVQLKDISPEALENITRSTGEENRIPLINWWLSDENLNKTKQQIPVLKRRSSIASIQTTSDVNKAVLPELRLTNTVFNSHLTLQRSASLGNIYSTNSTCKAWTGDSFFDQYAPGIERQAKRWQIPNASVAFHEVVTNMTKSEQCRDDLLQEKDGTKTMLQLHISDVSENVNEKSYTDHNDLFVENADTSDEHIFSLGGENDSTSSSSVGNIARLQTHYRRNSLGGKSSDSLPKIHISSATELATNHTGSIKTTNSAPALSSQSNVKSLKTKRAPPRSPSSNFIKQYATTSLSAPLRKTTSPGPLKTPRKTLQRTLSVDDLPSMAKTSGASNRRDNSPFT